MFRWMEQADSIYKSVDSCGIRSKSGRFGVFCFPMLWNIAHTLHTVPPDRLFFCRKSLSIMKLSRLASSAAMRWEMPSMMQVRIIRLFQILALPFFLFNLAFLLVCNLCHVDLLCCKVFSNIRVSSVSKALKNWDIAVNINNYYNILRQHSNNNSHIAKIMSMTKINWMNNV